MFKIREVEIPNRVVLAPMAGVCNAAFRLTAKEFGAGLVCAEMVSDKAILFNNKKTMNMLYIDPNYLAVKRKAALQTPAIGANTTLLGISISLILNILYPFFL